MSAAAPKKVFNCIADDTALVAGVKRSTRNGLRQWVKNGQIRLFVPLHGSWSDLGNRIFTDHSTALEHLNQQRTAQGQHGEDVRETLEWLDQATEKYPSSIALQGGDEIYEQWSDVQKFAVPRSLFSELDHLDLNDGDECVQPPLKSQHQRMVSGSSIATASSRTISIRSANTGTDASPSTSPPTTIERMPKTSTVDLSSPTASDVPTRLRSLFNYILWRIHQEVDPQAALESFIFLCNDPIKTNLAKGFEVRCKRLEQLRDAIGREEKETRDQQLVQRRSREITPPKSVPGSPVSQKPVPTAPAAMLKSQSKLIDPDAFDRSANITPVPSSPRGGYAKAGRGNHRGRGRNDHGSRPGSKGRGLGVEGAPSEPRIDPNSFERPRGGHVGRGGRKLWMPS